MPTTSEMDSSGVQQVQQQESKSNEKSNNNSEAMSVEDTEPASDEVKVYCNEEEEAEDDLRETEAKALSSLSDDKSTLITESEQSKEPPRGHHDLAFASKRSWPLFPLLFLKALIKQTLLTLQLSSSLLCFFPRRPQREMMLLLLLLLLLSPHWQIFTDSMTGAATSSSFFFLLS